MTDVQTSSHTAEQHQTLARPAASVVYRRPGIAEETLIPPCTSASCLTLRIPEAIRLNKLEIHSDRTDTETATEITSQGPEGNDPAPCLATPITVWPAGP